MSSEKVYFQKQFCNERECLPLANAIRQSLSLAEFYQPEGFLVKFKKWGEFDVKAYYRVNRQLYYATARLDSLGNILEKKLHTETCRSTEDRSNMHVIGGEISRGYH